ncbi:MAG: MoaD/ThiS family protein [Candidatus Thorarchaeota archaeon]|nr:MoaD/ThiS family protein [Candidatus Thorarchaeota archaeon]
MRVEVTFRGVLAGSLGRGQMIMELDTGSTIAQLLQKMIGVEQNVLRIWKAPEEVVRDALVLRNGVDIGLTGDLETTLVDGDRVVILPLVHGG